jgi:hypothetical protein
MAIACSTHGREDKYIVVGNPEGKIPPETPRCIKEDNIKMGLK